ncbi:MAG TPA: SLBB domain-containing protein [Chloroflexota bacterium]|nr:SLBB domain-containing protein [Chloroflexota bacterium]
MGEQSTDTPLGRWKVAATGVLLGVAAVGVAYWLTRQPVQQPIVLPTPGADGPRQLKVDVVGAVARPGLYTVPSGMRVADAIEEAGGAVDGADLARVNLASRLRDGQQVIVPTLAPAPGSSSSPPSAASASPAIPATPAARASRAASPRPDARLNLNRATEPELEALPGVGPVTANRILQHREKNGPFASPNDLRSARLVTARTWEQIKDLVEAP